MDYLEKEKNVKLASLSSVMDVCLGCVLLALRKKNDILTSYDCQRQVFNIRSVVVLVRNRPHPTSTII